MRCKFQVKESAGSEERKGVYVTSTEEHELSGRKSTANLVMKFAKGSKKEASVNVQEIKGVTRAYTGTRPVQRALHCTPILDSSPVLPQMLHFLVAHDNCRSSGSQCASCFPRS